MAKKNGQKNIPGRVMSKFDLPSVACRETKKNQEKEGKKEILATNLSTPQHTLTQGPPTDKNLSYVRECFPGSA